MQLKCGRIEKAGPRVETQHSALQMVCVSYLTQAEEHTEGQGELDDGACVLSRGNEGKIL